MAEIFVQTFLGGRGVSTPVIPPLNTGLHTVTSSTRKWLSANILCGHPLHCTTLTISKLLPQTLWLFGLKKMARLLPLPWGTFAPIMVALVHLFVFKLRTHTWCTYGILQPKGWPQSDEYNMQKTLIFKTYFLFFVANSWLGAIKSINQELFKVA